EELEIATEDMMSTGQMNAAQARLIENIFDMEDRTAQELMTSRARMVAIPLSASGDEVAAIIAGQTLARYPVFGASLDEVAGVLHVKDFIRSRVAQAEIDLGALVRPAPRVAASMPAYDLMALFRKQRVH